MPVPIDLSYNIYLHLLKLNLNILKTKYLRKIFLNIKWRKQIFKKETENKSS